MAFDDDWTDPTEEETPPRPVPVSPRRRRRRRPRPVVPWWLVAIGGLVVVLAIVLLWTWALRAMEETKEPPTIAVTPTFTRAPATSVPAVIPTNTPASPTNTPLAPTATPLPEIAVGGWVKVGDTAGAGLSFRAGPGQENARLKILAEGTVLKVWDGPREDQGYNWWRLEEYVNGQAGIIGWAVEDFLEPTSAP